MSGDNVGLDIWTVYDHPLDYPELFVARMWSITQAGGTATVELLCATDLELLRKLFEDGMGLTCIPRSPGDDPKIVECWL